MSARRLVIANRGEIARRILRAGRALGWQVAVVSTAQDAGARVQGYPRAGCARQRPLS